MNRRSNPVSIIRVLLLGVIVLAGGAAILATNGSGDCLEVNESCSSNSDCCHNHCEEGRCCRGIGADLASDTPPGDCCSGQIRTGSYGPYCCGTSGMTVSSFDRCCEGLSWNSHTGVCAPPCPAGCSWMPDSLLAEGGECECPPGVNGDGPELPGCRPCHPCPAASDGQHYIIRVYNDETDFCCVAGDPPFWAPDEETAEACALRICGCEAIPGGITCAFEDVTRRPDPYMTCPMP